jgi:MFS family permease
MAVEFSVPATAERSAPRGLVAILATCGVVVALMHSLVIPLLPELPQLLGTSAENASWVVTATLLSSAILTPISGRLGDMYGKRQMLLVSLGFVTVGSVACALANSLLPMVIGRTLQGAAAGAIPLGIAILRDELPPQRVSRAMAIISSTLGVGGAIGFPVAAAIIDIGSWRVPFVVAAVFGGLCIGLVMWWVPPSAQRQGGRFDVPGALGLTAALILLLLPITKGNGWGWDTPLTLGMFGASAVITLLWGLYQLRATTPMVNLRAMSTRPALLTNFATVSVGLAVYGNMLTFPQLLMAPTETGYGFGLSMVVTGLIIAPTGLVMMLFSPISARITDRSGARVTLAAGIICIGGAYALTYFTHDSLWHILIAAIGIGAGIGLSYSAMPALIMNIVPPAETAAANGINTLMRSIGMSTSAAVVSAVLSVGTVTVGTTVVPSIDSFQITFLLSIGAAIVALALTVAIPRARPKDTVLL